MIRFDGYVRRMKKTGGGWVAAHAILRGMWATRNLLREDKVAQSFSHSDGPNLGMQNMDQCLQALVEKRIITVKAAREKAREPDSISH